MYQNGRGVFKNYSTAIKWGQEALKNGYCEATYLMGHWGTDGVYLHPGTKTSKEWIDEAANLGNKAAQREIDHSFERSNIQNALKWYKKGFQLEDTASKDDMENTDEQSSNI
jgi:TPR repeat protein